MAERKVQQKSFFGTRGAGTTCGNNSVGINLYSSDDNTLTGNYLLNNATPYVDNGTGNSWS
jgi:parallel beta-helix repeat protein